MGCDAKFDSYSSNSLIIESLLLTLTCSVKFGSSAYLTVIKNTGTICPPQGTETHKEIYKQTDQIHKTKKVVGNNN